MGRKTSRFGDMKARQSKHQDGVLAKTAAERADGTHEESPGRDEHRRRIRIFVTYNVSSLKLVGVQALGELWFSFRFGSLPSPSIILIFGGDGCYRSDT